MFDKQEYIINILNGLSITTFMVNLTIVLLGMALHFSFDVNHSRRTNPKMPKKLNGNFLLRANWHRIVSDIIGIYFISVYGLMIYESLVKYAFGGKVSVFLLSLPWQLKLLLLGMCLEVLIAYLLKLLKIVKVIKQDKLIKNTINAE